MKDDNKNEAMNTEPETNEQKKKFFDNILDMIGVERYEEEYDDDETTEAEEVKQADAKPETKETVKKQPAKQTAQPAKQEVKATPAAQPTAKTGGTMANNYEETAAQMKVFTPAAVGEVREVCDQLRLGHAVIVNTDKLNDADYCRFYDFVYGAAYMIDGKVSQISDTVLILTPASIDITNAVKEEEPQTEEDIDDFFGDDIDTDDIDDLEI